MARTRTQQQAIASRQAHRTGARQKDPKRSKRPSKVQFSEVVHVKSIPSKNDQHSSSPSDEPIGRRNIHGVDPRQSRSSLKAHPKSNIHTMSTLPSPPVTEAGSSHHGPDVSGYERPGKSNVHTLTDFAPQMQHDPRTASRPSTPSNAGRAPTPEPLADVRHNSIDRRSSLIATPSPRTVLSRKRARADESSFYGPPAKRIQFEYGAASDLFDKLPHIPRVLAPEEISALFEVLRSALRDFAFGEFRHELSPAAQQDWPLHDMGEAYYPLTLATQYISDGSQYGWRHFFTTPDSRASLAYGVIAEYLRQHVFSAPAFGFSPEDTKIIEDADSLFLYYDSHVRARQRARAFRYILAESDWRSSSRSASDRLAQDLLTVLTPLLHPEIFRHDEKTGTFSVSNDASAEFRRSQQLRELSRLIRMAAGLHYSIRLTGSNGSIVRFCNTLNKAEKWFGDYDAPQNCINKEMIQKTQFHGWLNDLAHKRGNALDFADVGVAEGPDDDGSPRRPRIKMVCFPRIEMVVPRGPDQEELWHIQDSYTSFMRRKVLSAAAAPDGGDDDPSDDGSDGNFDESTRRRSSSVSSKHSSTRSHGDATPHPDDGDDASITLITTDTTDPEIEIEIDWDDVQTWYDTYRPAIWAPVSRDRTQIWEKAPDMVRHQYEQREGKWDEEKNGELRLPYQLHYQWISPNDVYLEHDYVEPTREGFVDDYFQEHSQPIVPPLNADQLRRVNRERHQLPRKDRAALSADIDGSTTSSDDDDDDDASTSSPSDPDNGPHSDVYEPKYDWAPGHSRATAVVAYENHIAHLRSTFMADHNGRAGWEYGNPLPVEQRVSLQEAIQQARDEKARASPKARLRFAATGASRALWNAFARRATAVEWGASGVACLVGLVWLYRRRERLVGAGAGVTENEIVRSVGRWVERMAKSGTEKVGEGWAQFKGWLEELDLEMDEGTRGVVGELAASVGRAVGRAVTGDGEMVKRPDGQGQQDGVGNCGAGGVGDGGDWATVVEVEEAG